MLLANKLAGKTLVEKCPEFAVLRKNPPPNKNLD